MLMLLQLRNKIILLFMTQLTLISNRHVVIHNLAKLPIHHNTHRILNAESG